MAAIDTLESGIKALSDEMSQFEDKNEADNHYAKELAKLIDAHAKALVAKIAATDVVSLGLVAGPYPVAPAPTPSVPGELKIDDSTLP